MSIATFDGWQTTPLNKGSVYNTSISAEYLAGFIDGDGCITFKIPQRKSQLFPQLSAGGTYEPILRDIKEQFGGSVSSYKAHDPKNKDAWTWIVSSRKAYDMIYQLYPFLRIKRKQAELVMLWEKFRPGRGCPWDESIREVLLSSMRELNHRGKAL